MVVPSSTSWHLLQLMDVNTALNPLLKRRRKDSYKAMKGGHVIRGDAANEADTVASSSASAYTYSIDTMGCQMNSADSERMEAQVDHTLDAHHSIQHNHSPVIDIIHNLSPSLTYLPCHFHIIIIIPSSFSSAGGAGLHQGVVIGPSECGGVEHVFDTRSCRAKGCQTDTRLPSLPFCLTLHPLHHFLPSPISHTN